MPPLKDSFDLVLENSDRLKDQNAAAVARAQVEAEAATSPDLHGKPGVTDAISGVVAPAARGVALGAANTLRTGEWLARSFGIMDKNQPSVGEYMANKIEADAEGKNNLPQNLIQGAAEFLTGLKGVRGVGAAASKVPGVGKALEFGRRTIGSAPQIVKDATAGTAAANVAFDPYQERLAPAAASGLAGLAGADPKIMDQLRSYLLASKDDPESLARLKGLLGDALTGAVASPAIRHGGKLIGKWGQALGSWLGDMAQQERQAPVPPVPRGPSNPQLQSAVNDYQRLRSGREAPTTPFNPQALQVAEQRALEGPLDYHTFKAEIWDQFRHLADQGETFEWVPSTRPTHPEMSELAPNGQTYATVLDAIHQKYGYEASGHVDPQQAWAQHGWMFSPEALPAYTAEIRARNMSMTPIEESYHQGVNDRIGRLNATMGKYGQPPLAPEPPGQLLPTDMNLQGEMDQGRSIPPRGEAKALRNDPALIEAGQSGPANSMGTFNRGELIDYAEKLGVPREVSEKLVGAWEGAHSANTMNPISGESGATRIFEDTTFNGKRMSTLFQTPNDNMVVIEKGGKDAGFLWYERQPGGGFKTHKIEVLPEFQRQGLATQLMDKVEAIEGPNLGPTTERTPQGQAFAEGRKKKADLSMTLRYDPQVESILGVPEAGRKAVQEAIAQEANRRGVKPYDLQEVLKAIDALKEK